MMSMSSKQFLSEFIQGLFNKNSPKDTYVSNIPVRRPTQPIPMPVRRPTQPSSKEAPPVFQEVLKEAESSNNYQAVSPGGYMGAYQFGDDRLQDFKDDTNKNFSREEFLNSKELQDEVFTWHTNDIKKYIKDKDLEKYIGQEIQGSPVTMDGLVAVAHLGGKYGMRKFLETDGEYNPSDANETKLSDYLVRFGNSEMGRLGFRFGGGADASKSDFGGNKKGDGPKGKSAKHSSLKSSKGLGLGKTVKDSQTKKTLSNLEKLFNKVFKKTPTVGPSADDTSLGKSYKPEKTVKDVATDFVEGVKKGAKNVTEKVKTAASNVPMDAYGFSNIDVVNNPIGSGITLATEGYQGNIGFMGGPFGPFKGIDSMLGAGIVTSVSPEDIKAGKFKTEKDFEVKGNFYHGPSDIGVQADYNIDKNVLGVEATKGFSTDLGGLLQNEIEGRIGFDADTSGNFGPALKVSLKKGGLLDRSRKK